MWLNVKLFCTVADVPWSRVRWRLTNFFNITCNHGFTDNKKNDNMIMIIIIFKPVKMAGAIQTQHRENRNTKLLKNEDLTVHAHRCLNSLKWLKY